MMSNKDIGAALAAEYDHPTEDRPCRNIQELKETSEYAEAFQRTQNPGKALRQLASKVSETEIQGWFLNTDVTTYEDDDGNEQRSVGPRVLLPDGRTRKVSNGQEINTEPLSPVVAENVVVKRSFDFNTGEWESNPKLRSRDAADVKVQTRDHGMAPPELTASNQIDNCFEVQESPENRGTIRGRTFWQIPVFVTVGGEDAVRFFPGEESNFGNEDTLKVTTQDSDGNSLRFKLDIDHVCETFGINRETATESEFETALADEPLFVYGSLGVTYPMEEERIPGATEEGRSEDLRNVIETLRAKNRLTEYDTHDETGAALEAVNFHNWYNEDGTPMGRLGLRVGDVVAYDIRETAPDEWEIVVSCEDQNKPYWMDVREHAWTNDAGQSGVSNEGAFVTFLNYSGGSLPEDDPAHQLALSEGLIE